MPAQPRSTQPRAAISAVASYVPERILTNAELALSLETSDEWIVTRTGIRERRIGAPGETTSTMGAEAVRRLMAKSGVGPDDIDALIVATVTPDMLFPATACLIQDQLKLGRAWGFDLSAACSGFLYALTIGAQLVATGAHRRVVVVGADLMSSIIDPLDRTTAVLFGDGAGAVLLEQAEPGYGILDFHHRVDGSGRNDLLMPAGGSLLPPSAQTVAARQHFLKQNGKVVFKFAVSQMVASVQTVLASHGLTPSDVALVVPHQANQRILDAVAERLCLPHERVASVLARWGNTTGATLPLALDDALAQGKIKRGDLVVFTAVGAGFTAGATLVRWS
ncbi:MAG TPA: beta-ketoacyl-ACP synthase III [Gemmatimonadales bacterium]|jgi:3-oxoacyl-[acyl-carrier-protein] synthase-3|nr:beta-ketoacyl-ACP synthase III [Gemmatimonadales bacterium]